MEEKKIRLLRAEEIECRVATVSEKGVSLLLYKDARVDQNILDETFGIFGWKREHQEIGGELFCTVSIRDENGQWVSKQDVGKESFAEPIKGAASDSFKRACFNIGIGRELYTVPFLWVPAEKVDIRNKEGKIVVKDRFHVSAIQYDERRAVSMVEIRNQKQQVVFTYEKAGKQDNQDKYRGFQSKENKTTVPSSSKKFITAAQEKKLRKEMERTGVEEKAVCDRYQVTGIREMDRELYERAMEALSKTKTMAA